MQTNESVMKAAILRGPGDIRIEEVDRPKAGDDGIVVRVRAAGVCGSDLHPYKLGNGGSGVQAFAAGHANAGEVVEVGAHVQKVAVGDRVWVEAALPCFECDWCKKGGYKEDYFGCRNIKLGGINGLHGGFAEYLWVPVVVLPEEGTDSIPSVIKLPDSMSYQDGALIEPVSVGAHVTMLAEPKPGDVAVVIGAGIVGLASAVNLLNAGASRVIVSDVSQRRLKAAMELGAEMCVNATEEDLVKAVMKATNGRGADIVVEAAGLPETFKQATKMVRAGGKLMLVGIYEKSVEFHPNILVFKGTHVIGCINSSSAFLKAFEVMRAGKVKDKQVVTHTFPLDRINEAFETALNTQESIKVMIEP
jgi:2-desacetyl-2-hydroxyethyl bacteriochlorophyllide A dehydrogenase